VSGSASLPCLWVWRWLMALIGCSGCGMMQWDFNVFEVAEVTSGHPLLFTTCESARHRARLGSARLGSARLARDGRACPLHGRRCSWAVLQKYPSLLSTLGIGEARLRNFLTKVIDRHTPAVRTPGTQGIRLQYSLRVL
jgi:hypothetical protein